MSGIQTMHAAEIGTPNIVFIFADAWEKEWFTDHFPPANHDPKLLQAES